MVLSIGGCVRDEWNREALTGGAGIALGFVVAIGMNASGDETKQDVSGGPDVVETDVSADNSRHTPVTRAVERVAPSVVSITTEQPPSRLFGRAPAASSDGSGVVIDTNGIVLTNAHVVSSASRIIVSFDDGVQTEARVIGLAENLDLAVLKIPLRPELKAAEIGSSEGLLLMSRHCNWESIWAGAYRDGRGRERYLSGA